MPSYPRLAHLLAGVPAETSDVAFQQDVVPYLLDVWLDDYTQTTAKSEIVETTTDGFSYLFDIANERLISAWGISAGRSAAARPKSRMKGHPMSQGPKYHRGHAIAHTLGGPTDINLVPQLASVNIGPFRSLEKRAVATPGALYFTYWMYGRSAEQTPDSVEQGFLCPGQAPEIRTHGN